MCRCRGGRARLAGLDLPLLVVVVGDEFGEADDVPELLQLDLARGGGGVGFHPRSRCVMGGEADVFGVGLLVQI